MKLVNLAEVEISSRQQEAQACSKITSTPTCKTGCIKTKTFSVIKQTFSVIKPCSTETVSKKICGPSARKFFSREIFGAASVSPCAGRNLRRRVLAEICAAVCWPKIWRKSAPPCCVVIFDALVLHVSVLICLSSLGLRLACIALLTAAASIDRKIPCTSA